MLGGSSNRHLFLTVLQAAKSKVKTAVDLVSDISFPSSQKAIFSLCLHVVERREGALLGPFYKNSIPFMRVYSLDLIPSHRSPLQTPPLWTGSFLPINGGGHTHSVCKKDPQQDFPGLVMVHFLSNLDPFGEPKMGHRIKHGRTLPHLPVAVLGLFPNFLPIPAGHPRLCHPGKIGHIF